MRSKRTITNLKAIANEEGKPILVCLSALD